MKFQRSFLRRYLPLFVVVGAVLVLGAAAWADRDDDDGEVRWDIISVNPLPAVNGSTISAGGEAFAFAYHTPGNPSNAVIRLTGFGTFVAPASGGCSRAVTGGGTWATSGSGLPVASGTYRVTKLVNWQFGGFQTGGPAFIDKIGDVQERANGNAVFLIEYDDGSEGILGIACHGPGAPNGILEGVIASKGHVTYWNGQLPPAPAVDANRTLFHVDTDNDDDDDEEDDDHDDNDDD